MGILNHATMDDGSVLTVAVGTDRALYAHIRYADGNHDGWISLGGKVTSTPEVARIKNGAVIDVLGTGDGSLNQGEFGGKADYWVPARNVYTDDRAKKFKDRFGGFAILGGSGSRVVPLLPPLP